METGPCRKTTIWGAQRDPLQSLMYLFEAHNAVVYYPCLATSFHSGSEPQHTENTILKHGTVGTIRTSVVCLCVRQSLLEWLCLTQFKKKDCKQVFLLSKSAFLGLVLYSCASCQDTHGGSASCSACIATLSQAGKQNSQEMQAPPDGWHPEQIP